MGGWGARRVQGLFRGQEEVSLKGSLGTGREQKQVRWVRLYPQAVVDSKGQSGMNRQEALGLILWVVERGGRDCVWVC